MTNQILKEMGMSITKASFDKTTGIQRFRMVCSDISADVFDEKMSLELFNDFTSRIDRSLEVPMPFKSILSEKSGWSGGMPYVSLAHYKSGKEGKNVPADTEKVYIDGEMLKATAACRDTPLGKAVFKALKDDLEGKSDYEEKVRVSIGFLDLSHSHGDYVFTRDTLEKVCPMCENEVGNKIYLKGQLVHLALTRAPANPRTDTEVDMSKQITTKREDAESIVGESLVDEVEVNKSMLDDEPEFLVVKAEVAAPVIDDDEMVENSMTDDGKKMMDEAKKMMADGKMKGDKEMMDKAQKMMDKAKMMMKSVVADPEPAVVAEVVERSALDTVLDDFKEKVLAAKSMTREDALKALQPDFELVAKAVQDEFVAEPVAPVATIDPALVELLTSMKSIVEGLTTQVGSLVTEVAILKSQGVVAGKTIKATEVPEPRNVQIERTVIPRLTDIHGVKPLSIGEIAKKSVYGNQTF